jgi:hypothetical protein
MTGLGDLYQRLAPVYSSAFVLIFFRCVTNASASRRDSCNRDKAAVFAIDKP